MAELANDEALAEALNSGMALAYHAGQQGEGLALASRFGDRTFNELNGRTNQLVRFLRDRGIGEGDAIAVVARNRPEFVEGLAAALRSGIRFTPVNFHLTGDMAAQKVFRVVTNEAFGQIMGLYQEEPPKVPCGKFLVGQFVHSQRRGDVQHRDGTDG